MWRLTFDLCRGLHYLHLNKISHGDVRPKNVYLRHDGTAVIGDHAMITNWKTGYQRVLD